jgi:hypothetical protein
MSGPRQQSHKLLKIICISISIDAHIGVSEVDGIG